MARKRPNPKDQPPTVSSSEEEEEEEQQKEETSSEEEEEGGEGEEGSSSDDDGSPVLKQKSQPPKKPETPAPVNPAGESEESDSESESESESDTPASTVKPIATKPMEETSNAKKPRSKPLASPVKASAVKRPNESEQEPKETKRAKKKPGEEGTGSTAPVVEEVKKTGEDAKKQLFQRLFSEDDEIALLKGMLDYAAKKGADPCADMNAFYDFVKKSIHTDVTKAQMMDKIRRLKKKYENNAGKGKKGEDRTFSKPHEHKAFDLSKKIWGKEGISGKVDSSSAKLNGKAKGNSKALAALKAELLSSPENKVDAGEPIDVDKKVSKTGVSLFDKRFGVAGLEEEVLNHGLEIIGVEKRAALEEKWRKLQIAELELFLQRSELIKEQAKLLLEYYKSKDK